MQPARRHRARRAAPKIDHADLAKIRHVDEHLRVVDLKAFRMPGEPDLGNLGAHRGIDDREGALAVPDKHSLARAIDPDIVGILAEIDTLDGREILTP